MIFIVAANLNFVVHANTCVNSLKKLKYKFDVVDLGGLDFGISSPVLDENFNKKGYYRTHFRKHKSRALHKPSVIYDYMSKVEDGEFVVYLDADTLVRKDISEVEAAMSMCDIGVTVRRKEEIERNGLINAGVLFFRKTPVAMYLLSKWIEETKRVGNDQFALIEMLNDKAFEVCNFSTEVYNWYYFGEEVPDTAKIVHLRASASDFTDPNVAKKLSAWEKLTREN